MIERQGGIFLDYKDPDLLKTIRELEPNGMDAVLISFRGKLLRQARAVTKKKGIVVSFAFSSEKPGNEKIGTFTGALELNFRRLFPFVRPHNVLCSVPMEISSGHEWYRSALTRALKSAIDDHIYIDSEHIFDLKHVSDTHVFMDKGENQGKVILNCGEN